MARIDYSKLEVTINPTNEQGDPIDLIIEIKSNIVGHPLKIRYSKLKEDPKGMIQKYPALRVYTNISQLEAEASKPKAQKTAKKENGDDN